MAEPLSEVARQELRSALLDEVQRLPDKYRAPLILVYWEGKTHEQAAGELALPRGSMAKRLDAAKALLRRRLARRGITVAGGLLTTVLAEEVATAAVPAGLADSTAKAALLFALGQAAAAGGVGTRGAALAKGVLRTMFLTKLKIASVLLAACAVALGTGLVAQDAVRARPTAPVGPVVNQIPAAEQEDRQAPAIKDGERPRPKGERPAAKGGDKPRPRATPPAPAPSHRVLVLDILLNRPGADHHRLRVLEIESGKTLTQTEIGFNSDVALSPRGDVVAAIYATRVRGIGQPGSRLDFYRAGDLKRLESGLLPPSVPRIGYQLGASADSRLSPDGRELLIDGVEPSFRGSEDLAETSLNCVKRALDAGGYFERCRKVVRIPRSYGVQFLRVADWPRVHLWNSTLGLLEVVDLDSGKILSRLPQGDDPEVARTDPAELENAEQRLILRLRHRGYVVAGGRYAYYIPVQPSEPGERPGSLRKIDLTANPPQVVLKGEGPQPDLGGPTAVSEAAGALFAVKYEPPRDGRPVPMRRVKVFRTKDLKLRQEFDVPLKDCQRLEVSRDGKYLYALDPDEAKLAVIDTDTCRPAKVLDEVGQCPYILLALPER